MENTHKDITLSQLREYIIRYGAKLMNAYESDLFYDCSAVGKMQVGESKFWMVSEMHTYLYSANEIKSHDLNEQTIWGNRANWKITCVKKDECNVYFDLERVWTFDAVRREMD